MPIKLEFVWWILNANRCCLRLITTCCLRWISTSTDQQLVSIDEERNLLKFESRLQEHRPELELSNQSKPERLLPLPGDKLAVISTEGDTTKAHL